MPRLKSAIKRVAIGKRNYERNLKVKSTIKTLIKKVAEAVDKKDLEEAKKASNEAFSLLDRAATKKVLHQNNASRKKARISLWLKQLESKAS